MNLTLDIKTFCKSSGADLVGIADLEPFKQGWTVLPQNLLEPYTRAISIAMHVNNDIISAISDVPTPEYAQHYRSVNASLDKITSQLVQWIIDKGFNAKAIQASHIVDENNLLGNISHKAVARMAGIGWQGKSLLIISPEYGPRIRLATVITNMPLEADQPLKNRCGRCMECAKACPASAIKNVSTESHYESRDEAIHLDKCHGKLCEFKARPGVDALICGVCIKVCPFGKKSRL
ncbi:iron-sulfur-binding protein [Dissulfurispira thermophila]|uniref:Iron-sulfur-binding protein n=1 Tax=Dissulfurispira thermophila TaxID=2715679 RepID=A0A7G1H2V8_9BACT|nr:iron-sulfur-binding protein [Dissulfurispira thermophila]